MKNDSSRFGHIIQLFTVLLTAILISLFFAALVLVGKILDANDAPFTGPSDRLLDQRRKQFDFRAFDANCASTTTALSVVTVTPRRRKTTHRDGAAERFHCDSGVPATS